MKNKSRTFKIICIVLSVFLAFSLFMVFRQLYDYHQGDLVYSEAMAIAGLNMPEYITSETYIPSDTEAEIEPETESEPEPETESEPESEPEPETEAETETESESEKETETVKETETKKETETVKKTETKKETETAKKPETKKETETVKKPETKKETETEKKPETKKETETPKETEPPVVLTLEEILASINIKALQQVNSDVIGWILIPESAVSYPIVQGTDNDFYLNHTWKKTWNSVGAIFMDSEVSPDFTDFNSIVYGHRMGNGTMFNTLGYYKDYWWWTGHSLVYLITEAGVSTYRIFSSYEAGISDITYGLDITKEETKEKFISHALEKSVINTGVAPTADDLILTLSTCTRSGSTTSRWVVHAVLCTEENQY